MLNKLFGSKKEEFFVELDDSKGAKKEEAPTQAAAPEVKEEKKEDAVKPKKEAKPTAKKEEKKPAAKSQKKAEKKAEKPAPAPQPKAKPAAPKQPVATGFATQFLMPNSVTPRRRPSANMKAFLDMAKETNAGR
ncbi:hypothetical protein [Baaleninema sp.]|uniref:hypothetical protein n=1 Tax=Baaleninema sp. TaxID=3101197 RepID=UPI003CFF3C5F